MRKSSALSVSMPWFSKQPTFLKPLLSVESSPQFSNGLPSKATILLFWSATTWTKLLKPAICLTDFATVPHGFS
jgi:hypothetical protein